jgi:signal peptidase
MRLNAAVVVRRSIKTIWLVLLGSLLALVALSRIAPLVDHEMIVIRGASMAPAIPLGSLAVVRTVGLEQIGPGDVVTLRLQGGVLLTHRVLRVATLPDGTYLETKGDGNADPDPVLVPGASVIGVVAFNVPHAGFVLAFLSLPSGILSAVSLLASLVLAAWLLEDDRKVRPRLPIGTAASPRPSGV